MGQVSRIAHYEVERELGRGAMGIVYLARDLKLGRPVAIKSLPEELATDIARRVRFETEARTLASVNHPNVGAIYGVEEAQGSLYLILELAEGPTLGELLLQREVAVDEAIDMVRQVALGIDAAHQRGVVHRDLKPANIKIRPDGVVKVLDFGIAMAGEVQGQEPPKADQATIIQTAMTHSRSTGMVIGTPGYMSPEQARGRPVSTSTDIWALGCILYESLARRVAFAGDTVADALATTLLTEPDYARLPGRTPSRVLAVLKKCLEKDPRQRTIRMSDAAEELGAALQEARSGRGTRVASALRGLQEWPPARGTVAAEASPLIARDRELADAARVLEGSRALTLTGPAGCGKSRLALATANALQRGFDAGAWWVPIPVLREPSAAAFVAAITMRVSPGPDAAESLVAQVGAKSTLIVLDGAEGSAPACAALAQRILDECPGARVLATARSPLGLSGEVVVGVGPLSAPSSAQAREGGARLDAARLFIESATRAQPSFTAAAENVGAIADLCRFVGGWPLPVELLGGMCTPSMDVQDILSRLEQRSIMLGSRVSDVLPADTANNLVAGWALDQLSAGELAIVLQAAIFSAPSTIRQISAAGGARDSLPRPEDDDVVGGALTVRESRVLSILPRLAARSLVRLEGDVQNPLTLRVRMSSPIRRAALERLRETPAAEQAVRNGHRAYCLASLEQALPHMSGSGLAAWSSRLDAEYPEFLWAVEHGGADDISRRIKELAEIYRRTRGSIS